MYTEDEKIKFKILDTLVNLFRDEKLTRLETWDKDKNEFFSTMYISALSWKVWHDEL